MQNKAQMPHPRTAWIDPQRAGRDMGFLRIGTASLRAVEVKECHVRPVGSSQVLMGLPPGVAVASLGVPSFQQPLGEEQAPLAAAGLAVVAAGLVLLVVGEGLAGAGESLLGELLGLGEFEGLGLELELELEVVPALARPAKAAQVTATCIAESSLSLMDCEFARHHGLLSPVSG